MDLRLIGPCLLVALAGAVLLGPSCSSGKTGTAGTGGATAGTGAATAGTGVGTAGTGAGTAGATATGAAGTAAAPDTSQSVLTRNKHETRDGFFTQPTLTKAMAAKMAPDTDFNAPARIPGRVWGSPLYMENGPGGKG